MTPSGPGLARDRRRDHRLEAGPLVELCRFGRRRELADEVVAGDDDPVLGDRSPGGPDADRDPEPGALIVGELPAEPVVVGPAEVAGRRVEQVEDDAVRPDQTPGVLDDVLEDLRRLAQDRDPGGDLAKRLLGLGAPGQGVTGAVELRRSAVSS